MARLLKFTQREITRMLKAALAAGILVAGVEYRPNGTMVIVTDRQPSVDSKVSLPQNEEIIL